MEENNNTNGWIEIGKAMAVKLPASLLLFVTTYFLYSAGHGWQGNMTLFGGLLLCIWFGVDELYRGTIKSLKSDVTFYHKMANKAQTQSFENTYDATEKIKGMQGAKYSVPGEVSTTASE